MPTLPTVPTVLLATSRDLPDGEPGGEHLPPALAGRGIAARWATWDDPEVDWAAADLVAVRSTWDYHERVPEFLAWARHVEGETRLLNGADTFAWNLDKAYLAELAEHTDLPVVPTRVADPSTLPEVVASAVAESGQVVVKPRTGAGGRGVVVVGSADDPLPPAEEGPWVVQPLVESVRTLGETSVFVLDGGAVSQVDKRPAEGQILVHQEHGGRSEPAWLTAESARVAEAAVRAAGQRLGAEPAYARVDLMRYDGRLSVSEVELIEPGLYLDVNPGLAGPFAAFVAGRLG